ncbi:MAG: class I SAM-dependent methyltransferase [Parachlamydiaceae bacterium]|nr:class I SAM-dependent methyltransferase [Parachlamydiaceae bacterium]
MEEERLKRTLELILRYTFIEGKQIVDLGCGHGIFSRKLAAEGALVDAVDISANALKPLKEDSLKNIRPIQDLIPQTLLEDDSYDLVVSTDAIAYLPEQERRLYFAELSRLVKSDGFVICSTGIDIDTVGGFEAFEALAETEFQILEWIFSYHAFFIRIKNLLKRPERFVKGYQDKAFRMREASLHSSMGSSWYRFNSSLLMGPLWALVNLITHPLLQFLDKNRTIMLWLEKLCRVINQDGGLSHALFIGIRRPLKIQAQEEPPVPMQQKRRVWE